MIRLTNNKWEEGVPSGERRSGRSSGNHQRLALRNRTARAPTVGLPERKKVNASSSAKLGSAIKYGIETSIFVGSPRATLQEIENGMGDQRVCMPLI
jgi:hypothetical protein